MSDQGETSRVKGEDKDELPSSQGSVRFSERIPPEEEKIFKDSIHGNIKIHPLLVKIIDTPQFQRLRNIKQLGATYFVYPGASHNRFEHCIGTAHLAGKLTRLLQMKHPDLIDDKDVLCVEIAGLCHDLGHGPFSHMFDGMYMNALKKKGWLKGAVKKHEKMSCDMLDHLMEVNDLTSEFKEAGIDKTDLKFVKELINPKPCNDDAEWPYEGRGEEKSFLYEIISNERNKVDVDKWDYFARDCHHLGLKNSFDHERFMECMTILKIEGGRYQLGARDKECLNLYEMFHVRSALHRRAYQHRVCNVIELMICDAFIAAEFSKCVQKVLGGKKLSECVNDPAAFTKLDDGIFQIILHAEDGGEGSKLLEGILKRKTYRYLGTMKTHLLTGDIITPLAEHGDGLSVDDFSLAEVKYSFGMGKDNPIDKFLFFRKDDPLKPYHIRREDVSAMLPSEFEEREIQVFCKSDIKFDAAKTSLKKFCKDKNIKLTTGIDIMTPMKRESQTTSEGRANVAKQLKFVPENAN